MSRLRFNAVSTPSTPAAGKGEPFLDTADGHLKYIGSDGVVRSLSQGYKLVRVTTILQGTVSYTPTVGVKALFVECIGAGAGGGGVATGATNGAAGGGGGGGAYSAVFSQTNVVGAHTVQVGAGGNGGTAGANNGSVGTDTTFADTAAAVICTAKGGNGGIADTVAVGPRFCGLGGAGGTLGSGVGDIKTTGMGGGCGVHLAAAQSLSGCGAGGMHGMGGGIEVKNATGGGSAGAVYGAGGSGGAIISGGASQAGGNGANGLIIVWEFA